MATNNFNQKQRYEFGLPKKQSSSVNKALPPFSSDKTLIKDGAALLDAGINNLDEFIEKNPDNFFEQGKKYYAYVLATNGENQPTWSYFDSATVPVKAVKEAKTEEPKPEPTQDKQIESSLNGLSEKYESLISAKDTEIELLRKQNESSLQQISGLADQIQRIGQKLEDEDRDERVQFYIETLTNDNEKLHAKVEELSRQLIEEARKNAAELAGLKQENARLSAEVKYWERKHTDYLENRDKLEAERKSLHAEAQAEAQQHIDKTVKGLQDDIRKSQENSDNLIKLATAFAPAVVGWLGNTSNPQQPQQPQTPVSSPNSDMHFLKTKTVLYELGHSNIEDNVIMNLAEDYKAKGLTPQQITPELVKMEFTPTGSGQ